MLEVKNLTFKYGGSKQEVFSDFNLTLSENCIYGLLGKNGTGKSTLLYLITGLLHPSKGEAHVDNFLSADRNPDMLREMFIVPEEFNLPAMTLRKYVKLNKVFYPRFSEELLEQCLKEFELSSDLKLNALSMGQKKKVFMSFALAANTKWLLMDEPTNGLDIPSKTQFRKVIAQCMAEDRTIIISTHQVHDVEALLDHVVILDRSQLLLDASVAEITDKYAFSFRHPSEMTDDVLYAEPSIQGTAVVARRQKDEEETAVNLELLFNAVTQGKLNS
ncbi:MAG: ATP-binding cassette domain-containing protein [Prevotella sp.]|nr:ATP-binding cassette domain-containing protein [Prevotella sp.]